MIIFRRKRNCQTGHLGDNQIEISNSDSDIKILIRFNAVIKEWFNSTLRKSPVGWEERRRAPANLASWLLLTLSFWLCASHASFSGPSVSQC